MKRQRTSSIDPEELRLFRESVAGVAPLPHRPRVLHPLAPPRPVPSQRILDERAALGESMNPRSPWDCGLETGEELTYARNGVGPQVIRKLRRGHWVVQAELDLHGLRVDEARETLALFVNESFRNGRRCIRIIHGKGLRSKNREPVLKRKVAHWLMQRDQVMAFCQAPRADGGAGAVIVLLASRR